MKKLIALAMVALALAGPAYGATFYDKAGRVTGTARTDANGVTKFYDSAGRTTGTARTDANGVTTFKNASGFTTGTMRR